MILKENYLYKLSNDNLEFIGIYIKEVSGFQGSYFTYVYSTTSWHSDTFIWDIAEFGTIVIEIGHKDNFPEYFI